MRDRDTAASRLIDDLFKNYGTGAAIDIATKAIADARAAGYAEAIEQAAKVANDVDTARRYPPQLRGIVEGVDTDVAKAIRALAPATTKEPK